jgi:alpha-tubulin suppressor-like RCC1 family protein
MATGHYQSHFIKGGKVYCSGYDSYGQCGSGSTTSYRTNLVAARNINNAKQVAAGYYHTCVLTDDKKVYCYGYNGYGALGIGNTSSYNYPRQVNITNVKEISVGRYHTCALKEDATTWCWGYGYYGALMNGSSSNRYSPTRTQVSGVKQISAGYLHSCALLNNGSIKCAGYNYYSQVKNTSNYRCDYYNYCRRPYTVSGISGVVEIQSHAYHNCFRRSNGTVGCWGYASHGQMGDGNTSTRLYGNRTVSGISTAVELGGGRYHSCARLNDGKIKCWGYGYYGQMGNGSRTSNNTRPVEVSGISNAGHISGGQAGYHQCAWQTDGKVKCWGYGNYGQRGDGDRTSYKPTPVTLGGVLAPSNDDDDDDDGGGALQYLGKISVGNLYQRSDALTQHNSRCVSQYGSGARQCKRADAEALRGNDLSRLSSDMGNGYVIVNDGARWAGGYGWYYQCRLLRNSVWSGTWGTRCNGQAVPCCKGGSTAKKEFRQNFSGNNSQAQCNSWKSFMDSISANASYSKIKFGGNGSGGGEYSCSGTNANTLCQALRTRTAKSISCDGRTWRLSTGCTANSNGAGNGAFVLHVGSNYCSCESTGYVIRPCILNNNWGAFGRRACGNSAQQLYVSCE